MTNGKTRPIWGTQQQEGTIVILGLTGIPPAFAEEPHYEISHLPRKNKTQKGGKNTRPIKNNEGLRLLILNEIDDSLESIDNILKETSPQARATEGYYLKDTLDNLWNLCESWQDEFKDLVNILQLSLAAITLEKITNKQVMAYYKILDKIMRRTVRDDDCDEALDILESAGINPWSPSSGDMDEYDG